jgi:Na+/proline symporter
MMSSEDNRMTRLIVRRVVVIVVALALGLFVALSVSYAIGGSLKGFALIGVVVGTVCFRRLQQGDRTEYPRCGHCGYNLTGHKDFPEMDELICPECGHRFAEAGVVRPDQLHPKRIRLIRRAIAAISMLSLIVLFVVWAYVLVTRVPKSGFDRQSQVLTVCIVVIAALVAALTWRRMRRCRRNRSSVK